MIAQNPKITVAFPTTEAHKQRLQAAAPQATFCWRTPDNVTADDIRDADILIGRFPPSICPAAEKVQWLQCQAAGPDAWRKPGVLRPEAVLTTASGAYGLAVAEHMLAMTLMLIKKLHIYHDLQHEHAWTDLGMVTSLWHANVLVLGMGDIGSHYAHMCHGLGSQVTGVRRTLRELPESFDAQATEAELDALLPKADIVALCLPGGSGTYRMLDARRLALMKPGAVIVNGGRGNAVDTDALADALNSDRLGGAGLDVTDPEPLPADHPLWDAKNALVTPHISGKFNMMETLDRIIDIAAENLEAWLAGKPLRNVIGRE